MYVCRPADDITITTIEEQLAGIKETAREMDDNLKRRSEQKAAQWHKC
jgi:hypothetical protein